MKNQVSEQVFRFAGSLEMVTIKLVTCLPIHALRVGILRMWGAKIGFDVTLYHRLEVRSARRLVIGDRTIIGNGAVLDARGGINIGCDVNLSSEVHIWTAQHDWQSDQFASIRASVDIGDHAWVSARSTILPGKQVGEGAVVAAHSLVASDVDPYQLVGGVPAKPIAERPRVTYKLGRSGNKVLWW